MKYEMIRYDKSSKFVMIIIITIVIIILIIMMFVSLVTD